MLDISRRKIENFNQRCLRQLLGIHWWNKVQNVDVHVRAKSQSSEVLIRGNRLRWLGHVCRMPEERLPRQVLFSELSTGKRKRGRQHKRWKDCIKEDLKLFNMGVDWYKSSQDRNVWRALVFNGKKAAATTLAEAARARRERRHARRIQHHQP